MKRGLQEHFDQMKALFSEPDHTPRPNPFDKSGRMWTRNFPKRCATCGDTYYGYIPEEALWEPYCVDPEPYEGKGLRGTCGHPLCHSAEEAHQDRRNPKIQEKVTHQAIPAPLTKAGGLKRVK